VQLRVVPFNNDGPGVDMVFGTPVESFSLPAPALGTGPYLLLPGMTYGWMVRTTTVAEPMAADSALWGPWSGASTFRTPPPSASGISAVAPVSGSVIATLTPTLQWADTAASVFYYELQVSSDSRFDTNPATATRAVWWNLLHGGMSTPLNSWSAPRLEPHTTYYWRVRPRVQGDGAEVGWSPVFGFATP
jgi:hypothetical protein